MGFDSQKAVVKTYTIIHYLLGEHPAQLDIATENIQPQLDNTTMDIQLQLEITTRKLHLQPNKMIMSLQLELDNSPT
jgi:hypothetical protein